MTTIVAERVDANVYDAALERNPYFSWGAALAGAAVATAVTAMLIALGAGFGLVFLGPVTDPTPAKSALTAAAIYFFAAQAFGFAVGGFLAGRLCGPVLESREEEMFRSGAHGLVVWAISAIAAGLILIVSGLVAANVAGHAASAFGGSSLAGPGRGTPAPTEYWADMLFRAPQTPLPAPAPVVPTAMPASEPTAGQPATEAAPAVAAPQMHRVDAAARAEANRILTVNAAKPGPMDAEDRARLSQLVAEQTGMPGNFADRQVDAALARMHDDATKAAEAARKAAAYTSIWTALALFFGLLVATAAAILARMEEEEKGTETVTAAGYRR